MFGFWARQMRLDREDRLWLRQAHRYAAHEESGVPESDRFNGGQKMLFWVQVFAGRALLLCGACYSTEENRTAPSRLGLSALDAATVPKPGVLPPEGHGSALSLSAPSASMNGASAEAVARHVEKVMNEISPTTQLPVSNTSAFKPVTPAASTSILLTLLEIRTLSPKSTRWQRYPWMFGPGNAVTKRYSQTSPGSDRA